VSDDALCTLLKLDALGTRLSLVSLLLLISCAALSSRAKGGVIEPEALARGIVVRFSANSGRTATGALVVSDLGWNWGVGSPDARIPADGFTLEAWGLMHVPSSGMYTIQGRTDGRLMVRLAGDIALEGSGDALVSKPIALEVGFAEVRVLYHHATGSARLAIDWEGPGFVREPLPARLLYHDPAELPPVDRFEEGRRIADRLGCANCHAVLDLPRHAALGPDLGNAGAATKQSWLAAWLRDPTSIRGSTRMPAFGRSLSEQAVADLLSFLNRAVAKVPPVSNEIRMGLNVALAEKGRVLFRSLGCLGCHSRGGDLSSTALFRARPWFARAEVGRARCRCDVPRASACEKRRFQAPPGPASHG
jgi:mono/diheme cytochrome c family protein